MLRLTEAKGTRLSADALSDGTLKLLSLLAAIFSVSSGSILLIEDIDSGLPPAWTGQIVQLMEEVVQERQIQVLATTTSPLTLQAMNEITLGNTVVFGRHPEQGSTIMRRLKDLDSWAELAGRRRLTDLFSPDCVSSVP